MTGNLQAPTILKPDVINFDYWNPRLDWKFVKAKAHEEAIQKASKKPVFIDLDSQENIIFDKYAQSKIFLKKFFYSNCPIFQTRKIYSNVNGKSDEF